MSRRRALLCPVLCPLLAALGLALAPATALGSAYTRIEHAYELTGTVQPCRFSSRELEAALKEAPTYTLEYFGDFTDAVNAALAAQGGGQCAPRHGLSALRERGLAGVRPPAPPASVTAGTGGQIPLALLVALIMAGAFALGGGVLVLARALGYDPSWAQAGRHSAAEAEYRLSATWAEFRDWLRSAG